MQGSRSEMEKKYDLLIVGAGIVGMAHAYEARQRGLSVLVVEQNDRCVGASIRNFGFITVSGQRAGDTWRRAAYSAQVWKNLTQLASIKVLHQGTWILCERPEAAEVAKAFLKTEMGKIASMLPRPTIQNWISLRSIPLRV